jgi:hypothetical protein
MESAGEFSFNPIELATRTEAPGYRRGFMNLRVLSIRKKNHRDQIRSGRAKINTPFRMREKGDRGEKSSGGLELRRNLR